MMTERANCIRSEYGVRRRVPDKAALAKHDSGGNIMRHVVAAVA